MITLYAAAPDSVPVIRCSPPSWAAHIALIEEDLAHEVRWLRFDRGEHCTEAAAQPWQALAGALDAFEEHAAGELDVAAVLVVVYAETARSLGLATHPWPELEALLARTRRRPSLHASWPSTWPELR